MSDLLKEFEAFAARPLDLLCDPTPPLLYPDSKRPVFPSLARKRPKWDRLVVTVRHRLPPPATSSELKLLRLVLGTHSRSFLRLYSRHNGFVLFQNSRYRCAGLKALPIRRWRGATATMRRLAGCADSPGRFDVYFGVAFAWVPRTENFLVVMPREPRMGQIFLFQGDGATASKIATDFGDLIRRASKNPLRLMQKTGACMGFSDEQGIGWMPIRAVRKQCA